MNSDNNNKVLDYILENGDCNSKCNDCPLLRKCVAKLVRVGGSMLTTDQKIKEAERLLFGDIFGELYDV